MKTIKMKGGEKEVKLLKNMKNAFLVVFAISLLMLFVPLVNTALARNGHSGRDDGRIRIEVRNDRDDDEIGKFEVRDGRFEITGAVTSISGNTFVIAGQTFVIDPSRVENFEQEVTLSAGTTVKVEGSVIDGTNFVREIELPDVNMGLGQSRVRLDVRGVPQSILSDGLTAQGRDQAISILERIIAFLRSMV